MKYFITISAVFLVATALPAPFPVQDIGADNLELYENGNRTYAPRNTGLIGWGADTYGGSGGAVFNVFDPWALRDACNTVAPRIIHVHGRIDLTQMFTGSPGVYIQVGPFKTIIGANANAEITGGGLLLSNQQHVIIQNIKFSNALSYAPGEQPNGHGGIVSQVPGAFSSMDCVDINESQFIWIDHCEFSDDPWNANATPENSRRHNGLLTIIRSSDMISVSNNIFRNHNMNFLIGHTDGWTQDIGRLRVTVYLNWFQGTVQRNPMVRYGQVHVLNNLYTDVSSYGIGVHIGAQIVGERNYFKNTPRSWGFPVWNQPAANAHFRNFNNWLDNSNFDSGVSGSPNWDPNNHYSYTPMAAGSVEAHVRHYAGTW